MRDLDLLVSVGEQHRRQDAVRVRRRRGDAGADHGEALPRRSTRRTSAKGAARCRPTGARADAGGGALMLTCVHQPDRRRAPGADLRRLQPAGAVGGVHGVDGAQGLRLHPGPRRPEPGRLRRAAAAVRRRHQAALQGGAAARRRPTRSCSCIAPIISTAAAFAAFSVVPFGTETTLFGLLERAAAARVTDVNVAVLVIFAITSMGIYGIVLAGLELEQQVLAARRAALVGADDQLRAVLRAGAGGGRSCWPGRCRCARS